MTSNREKSYFMELPVVCIGKIAERVLATTNQWFVHSLYSDCLYCHDASQNIICIGQQNIGKGPFTLLCSDSSAWPAAMLSPGTSLNLIRDVFVAQGNLFRFNLQGAEIWDANLSDIRQLERGLEEDLRWLAAQARQHAPAESLGTLIPTIAGNHDPMMTEKVSVLTGMLQQRVMEVVAQVRQQYTPSLPTLKAGITDCLLSLVGMGRGLTPSGDDFLAGIVMGLYRMGSHRKAKSLAALLSVAAQQRTTQISLAFFQALAQGMISESFRIFIDGMGRESFSALRRFLDNVIRFGATSGWDTLAGIAFALSLELAPPKVENHRIREALC